MKIKYYKTSEDDILRWWFGLRDDDCSRVRYSPLEIIEDLKTGAREWYHKGVPLRLQTKFPLVAHRAKTNETK